MYHQVLMDKLVSKPVGKPYQPITPDDEGRIFSAVAGLWISLREGKIVMEDGQTGERLLSGLELQQQAESATQKSQRLADFLRSQGFDPDAI
jgi:hypothetical protein